MTKPGTPIHMLLFSTLLVFAGPAASIEEVYKWVDTEGATHYGQVAPAIQPVSLQKISLEEHNPEPVEQANLQKTLDIAKQLETSRLERERLRLEIKKANIEKMKALQAQQTAYNDSRRYYGYSSYYPPSYGRPHKPHHPVNLPHRPHPVHHRSAPSHQP